MKKSTVDNFNAVMGELAQDCKSNDPLIAYPARNMYAVFAVVSELVNAELEDQVLSIEDDTPETIKTDEIREKGIPGDRFDVPLIGQREPIGVVSSDATIADIKSALDIANIEYSSRATKADLTKIAVENGVSVIAN